MIVGRSLLLRPETGSDLDRSFHGHYTTVTDAAGAYAFEGIDAHQYPSAPHIWVEHHTGGSVIRELGPEDAAIDFCVFGTGKVEGVIEGLRGRTRDGRRDPGEGEPRPRRGMASVAKNGRFQLDDLPPGSYLVRAAGTEDISSVEVTVVETEAVSVTLVMKTPTVELTVIVARGRGRDLVIEPVGEGAGVGGRSRLISVRGAAEHCHLTFVRPGDYRLSLDRITWTPLRLAVSPAEQTVDLRRLSRT